MEAINWTDDKDVTYKKKKRLTLCFAVTDGRMKGESVILSGKREKEEESYPAFHSPALEDTKKVHIYAPSQLQALRFFYSWMF